jgi:hypothetical protein
MSIVFEPCSANIFQSCQRLPRGIRRRSPASIADRAGLCGGDDLAPLSWLQRMALVRPGVGALSRVLLGSEMLQSALAPSSVLVAQLPPAAGEKWLALPYGASVPEGELSIAAASSGVVDFGRPARGSVLRRVAGSGAESRGNDRDDVPL